MLKEKFKSFGNYETKQTVSVTIDSEVYPLSIQGNGKIPCFSVGGSTPVQRTLSPRFKETFTFYCCDYYFIEKNKLSDFSRISLVKIVDDIISSIDQLALNEVVLLGHSAFGIVALEVAKRNDPRIKGVIMLGTPTNSNQEVAEYIDKFFHRHASIDRKLDDAKRKEWYAKCGNKDVLSITMNLKRLGIGQIITKLILGSLKRFGRAWSMMIRFLQDFLVRFCLRIKQREILIK